MSYVIHSTANPYGWRPWSSRLSGLGADWRLQPVMRTGPGLGQGDIWPMPDQGAQPNEEATKSSALNLAAQLRAANQRLMALENQVAQSPDVARAIGRDVAKARQQYSDMASKFIYAYTALFGSTPDGLSAIPVAAMALAAGIFATVFAALYVWNQYVAVLETRAQSAQTQAQTQGSLAQQIDDARRKAADAGARGDKQTADQQNAVVQQLLSIFGQAAPPGGQQSFIAWLQDNAGWLMLGVGAIVVAPRLVERF